jgi:hypothetical protein
MRGMCEKREERKQSGVREVREWDRSGERKSNKSVERVVAIQPASAPLMLCNLSFALDRILSLDIVIRCPKIAVLDLTSSFT